MSEQPVVAHADTEAPSDPPKNERQRESFPTEHE